MSTIKGTIAPAKTTAQNVTGVIGATRNVSANVNYSQPANPSNNHAVMLNRDANDQHPINAISELEDVLREIDEKMLNIINDWSMDEDGFLYLHANGRPIIGPIGPFSTGGGGGQGGGGGWYTYTVAITNLLESRVITVPESEQVILKFNYSSKDEAGMDDGPGIGQILVGGIVRKTFSAVQGDNEINVTDYLSSGVN